MTKQLTDLTTAQHVALLGWARKVALAYRMMADTPEDEAVNDGLLLANVCELEDCLVGCGLLPQRGHHDAECGDCGVRLLEESVIPLSALHHLAERLTPGEEVPMGECPVCGALAYVVKDD